MHVQFNTFFFRFISFKISVNNTDCIGIKNVFVFKLVIINSSLYNYGFALDIFKFFKFSRFDRGECFNYIRTCVVCHIYADSVSVAEFGFSEIKFKNITPDSGKSEIRTYFADRSGFDIVFYRSAVNQLHRIRVIFKTFRRRTGMFDFFRFVFFRLFFFEYLSRFFCFLFVVFNTYFKRSRKLNFDENSEMLADIIFDFFLCV